MPKIKKPMLAGNFDPTKAKFPYIPSPKVDGIRFLMIDGVAVSRTFKPIRNRHIQSLLSKYLPNGVDGEITSGDTFHSSTSAVMTIEGTPDFTVWIFDYVNPDWTEIFPYDYRLTFLNYGEMLNYNYDLPFKVEFLGADQISNMEELEEYEKWCLDQGFEGVMLRDPNGTYKFGRSTVNDNILLKVKRFEDDEAELIEIQEKMSNQNEIDYDAFGYVKRSTSLDGMVPMNTTGTLIVRNKEGLVFGIGSGLNDSMRVQIWNHQDEYIGKMVKYKYFPQGVKELPRHPVFLGFRDVEDT